MFKKLTDIFDIKNYDDVYVLAKDEYSFTLYKKRGNYIREVASLSTSFNEFSVCNTEYENEQSLLEDVYDVNYDMDHIIRQLGDCDVNIIDIEEHFLDKLRTIISMCLNPVINDMKVLVGTPCASEMYSGRYYAIQENETFRFVHTKRPKYYCLFELHEPETDIPTTYITDVNWMEFREVVHTTLNLNGSVHRGTTNGEGYVLNHWEISVVEVTKDVYEKAKTMRNKLYNNVLELFNKYAFVSEKN